MLKWVLDITEVLSAIRKLAQRLLDFIQKGNEERAYLLRGELKEKFAQLQMLWEAKSLAVVDLQVFGRHVHFAEQKDCEDILRVDVETVEGIVRKLASGSLGKESLDSFASQLHPLIRKASLDHYRNQNFRDAVLNGVTAIFDLIRKKSGLAIDGTELVETAFSPKNPFLIFSDLESESGKNEQKGFLQILCGAYIGVRNANAHTLSHNLDEHRAFEYLVFWGLLAHRVDEAKLTDLARRTVLSRTVSKKSKK